jgi:serine/threonine protein kinase
MSYQLFVKILCISKKIYKDGKILYQTTITLCMPNSIPRDMRNRINHAHGKRTQYRFRAHEIQQTWLGLLYLLACGVNLQDYKPENLWLVNNGFAGSDYGLAKVYTKKLTRQTVPDTSWNAVQDSKDEADALQAAVQ